MAGRPATAEYVRRYAQLHPFGSTQEDPEGSKIDGISVLAFACLNDAEDYLVTADYATTEAADPPEPEDENGPGASLGMRWQGRPLRGGNGPTPQRVHLPDLGERA